MLCDSHLRFLVGSILEGPAAAADATVKLDGEASKSSDCADATDSGAEGTWGGPMGSITSMDGVRDGTFMDCNGGFCRGAISMGK